jgi:glycosyltransferase involved in cell wall biosynthesis
MTGAPISAIVASYNAGETIAACLDSLQNQRQEGILEIIVVDSSEDGTAEIVSRRFPEIRLFVCKGRKYPGDARNIAVSHAKGEILAFIDTDCVASPTWAREIVRAHGGPDPVIGGTIDNANPESTVGWAAYLCEFSQWMPNTPGGPAVELPACVLSVKRRVFDAYGPFLEGILSADSAFNWRLAEGGVRRLLVPSIRISHRNIERLGVFLRKQVRHGRFFASVRVSEKRFSRGRRLVHLLGTPLLPFVLSGRIAWRVVARRTYVREFLGAAPLIFLGTCFWSWGEMLGYAWKR